MLSKPRPAAVAAHAVILLAGLGAIVWAACFGWHPTITCHGVEMHPGDVCHRLNVDGSDKGKQQSYAAALRERREAVPVVIGMGVLAAGFGAALLRGELRRGRTH